MMIKLLFGVLAALTLAGCETVDREGQGGGEQVKSVTRPQG